MNSSRRGVALVMVLWILVILGSVGATVARGARTSTALASNARARSVARYAAESGVVHALASIELALVSRDSGERNAYLNTLESEPRDSVSLGDARFQWAVVDPSARLDVNAAPIANLTALLSRVGDPGRAAETARAIRRWIERGPVTLGDNNPTAARFVTPVRSLDGLREIPGVDVELLERAAPWLTVDGDGTVNRTTAPAAVLDAAFGETTSAPNRLLLVARGWLSGHALTHEIQAVYAISNGTLVLVSWRERTL